MATKKQNKPTAPVYTIRIFITSESQLRPYIKYVEGVDCIRIRTNYDYPYPFVEIEEKDKTTTYVGVPYKLETQNP